MLIIIASLLTAKGFAQATEIKVKAITDNIFKVWYDRSNYTTNMLVSVGEDGLLLVDTGQEEESALLKEKILEKWGQMPTLIINTHEHRDHTGGNHQFKGAMIIGHRLVRERLQGGSYAFEEFPEYSLPNILMEEEMTIHFNGEEIQMNLIPGAHDDNDITVWFKKSNIVCIGDLAYKQNFPSLSENTGTALMFPEVVDKMIELLPHEAVFVAGHYDDLNLADMLEFKKVVVETIDLVKTEFEKGKTKEEMLEMGLIDNYKHYANGYVSLDEWIETIIIAIDGIPFKKMIYDPIYRTYKTDGIDAAIKKYYDIKNNHADEYQLDYAYQVSIGIQLAQKGKHEEAIKFYHLELKEYPTSDFAYYTYFVLGNSLFELNKKKEALEAYKKGLELKPGNKTLTDKIKELEAEI